MVFIPNLTIMLGQVELFAPPSYLDLTMELNKVSLADGDVQAYASGPWFHVFDDFPVWK